MHSHLRPVQSESICANASNLSTSFQCPGRERNLHLNTAPVLRHENKILRDASLGHPASVGV